MWDICSHTLAPLTRITPSKVGFKWTKIKQDAFDEFKRILARGDLSAYPYFNEEFKIHTDASKFQLEGVISQKRKPIAFYGRKINHAQRGKQ